MRVLHLLSSPVFSGPAENVLLLAAAQRSLGMDVRVAVDRRRSQATSEELAVPRLRAAALLDDGGLELSVKSSPWALVRDLARLRRRVVDVLHVHFSHDHWLARLGRRPGTALIRSVHAPRSLGRSLPHADGFTVPVPAWASRVSGARPTRVLPALCDAAFRRPTNKPRLQQDLGVAGAPLIGMVSTFQPSRRHLLAVDAFARVLQRAPHARLVLVGDGASQEEVRRRVRLLGLDERVTFAGYQTGSEFVRWMQALDEVWILGLGNDFSGRTALQARACGVRVVAVDEGALGRWADTALSTDVTPEALARASEDGIHRECPLPDAEQVARDIGRLYEEAVR